MISKTFLVGRVGKINKDSFKDLGQSKVINFTLATTDSKYDKEKGGYAEETTWHNISAWNHAANFCRDYVSVGDLLYVEGSINQSKYIKEGEERMFTSIRTFTVKKLNKPEKKADAKPSSGSYDDVPF